MKINKHDTQGTKPLLGKGELGYDDYTAGGDTGRVYVGKGDANIALAKKSEVDTKLEASSYTASDVLAKVKTVDGSGSGLDADLLDGNDSTYFATSSGLNTHTSRSDNPHSVTKAQIGLGNVDNTSDVNKPISTATQTALNNKVARVTSTDNAIVRFDGTTGAVQNSSVVIDDNDGIGLGTYPGVYAGHRTLTISGKDASHGGVIEFKTSDGLSSAQIFNTSDQFNIYTNTNHPIAFTVNNTERMRIDSNGNVGIGVTPSAWSSYKALEIGTNGSALLGISGSSVITNNSYYTSGLWKYSVNGLANRLEIGAGNGSFQWYTAPSGTAGNGITWTKAMTLDANGNLGLGVTPNSGIKLQVKTGTNRNISIADQTTITGAATIEAIDDIRSSNIPLEIRGSSVSITRPTGTTMTLDSNGNVGIGTSSPINYAGYKTVEIRGIDSSHGGVVRLSNSDQSSTGIFYCNAGGTTLGSQTNMSLNFSTNDIEKMRIGANGNVLVGTTTDNGVDKLQVNGSIKANTLELTDILKVSSIYSQNVSATTLTLTFKGDHRYLGGILDIYYTNTHVTSNQTASRKYMFNFSNSNLSNSRNLTEIGTGIGSQLTLTNLVTTQVSGEIYKYVFTFTFPAGGYPRFKFLSSFENFSSDDIYNFTATIS